MKRAEPSPFRTNVPGLVSSPVVAVLDTRGVLTSWTPGACRLLGYRQDEVVGRSAADLLAADLPASALGSFERQSEWQGRLTLRRRDGGEVGVHLRASPLSGAGGGSGWVLVAVEPEAADLRGGMAATLKRWVFEQMPLPLAAFGEDLRVVTANAELRHISGVGEEALIGLRTADFVPDARAAERLEQVMAQAFRTGERVHVDVFSQVPSESRAHTWSTFVYPLKDPAGEVQGVCVGTFDISAQDRARQRLAVVNAASVRIGTTLDVAKTAEELAGVATEQFADFIGVDLLVSALGEDDWGRGRVIPPVRLRRIAQWSVLEGCPESALVPGASDYDPEVSPVARALSTGKSSLLLTNDPAVREWLESDATLVPNVLRFGVHSLIIVPLLARGTVLGVALFLRHRSPDPFDADDLLLAEEITARAALSIDNARRYTRERDTALALQHSMLPQPTHQQAAVETASRYLPAGSRAGVGGDWFDVIPLSGARVALVVGDVVGHGIQASATMGRLRTAVRTLADVDMPPDELLTHLDDLVLRMDREEGVQSPDTDRNPRLPAPGDIGATCLYAVYDPVARRCTVARAGHPAPAVVLPDGTVCFPHVPTGPPLGLGGLPFESAELWLPTGSLIALFTDGLIEAANDDVDTGLARLSHALAGTTQSLEQICDTVLDALLPGTPASDDVALLLARTRGLDTSQVATWNLPSDPASVAVTRREAIEQLAAWGLDEMSFTTELVVSELVTNAIRYGRPPIQLRLIHDTASLTCEVYDASNTAPHLRRARAFDEGGRGLLLVAQLTQRWGTRQTPQGKTIWTEQAISAGS
ncbi:SpoIIE family protein phosphatase [Streptomyces sp. NPDC002143]